MTAIASLAAALGSIWTRLAPRDVALEAVALMGPDQRKEAGMTPAAGNSTMPAPAASPPLRGWVH